MHFYIIFLSCQCIIKSNGNYYKCTVPKYFFTIVCLFKVFVIFFSVFLWNVNKNCIKMLDLIID